MQTRSSSKFVSESSSNPVSSNSKHRNRIRSKPRVESFSIPIVTMTDNRTMEEMLQAPTEGYGDDIVIPDILEENFEVKTGLLSLIQANQFHGFESNNPHHHIISFNRITSTLKFRDVPNDAIKLMLFPYSLEGAVKFATTPVNENCSAVILKKLPEKLGDPDKFLIPCDFPEFDECLALADLGASINLISLSTWRKLSLPELTSTPFLRIERALIDVYGEEITLRVDDEAITFKSGNPTETSNLIIALSSFSLTPFEGGDFILEDIEACLTSKSIPLGIDDTDFDLEGDIRLLEELLNKDPSSSPLPSKELNVEEIKTVKSSINEPSKLELKELSSHLEYAFLEGTDYPWGSPVHYVPKKGGMAVVKNEENELIPTRHVPKVHDGHFPQYDRENDRERTIGENRASWPDKLDDALWAFRTAFKTPIGCTLIRPFTVAHIFPYGTIELSQADGPNFKGPMNSGSSQASDSVYKNSNASWKATHVYPSIFYLFSNKIALDLEASCARGFVHRPLELQSLAYGSPIS
nr:hypothetical protein [Tanacetum cinerariifolium]